VESANGLSAGRQLAQPQHSETKASRGGFRWLVIFLLFYITVTNYIDRSAIAFATGAIKAELGLEPAEIGLILGAFGLGYAVTTFLGGIAVDRWGARAVLLVAAVMRTASIGVTGFAGGFSRFTSPAPFLGLRKGPISRR
jgi:MFS transporter, ACS family, hexuronate transporter